MIEPTPGKWLKLPHHQCEISNQLINNQTLVPNKGIKLKYMNFYLVNSVLYRIQKIDKRKYIMRINLTILILITFLLQVGMASYAQKISLNKKNAALTEVFKIIGKQTGCDFIYSTQLMKQAKPVSIKVVNASLQDVLEICFKDQPFEYELDDNTIIIKPRRPTTEEKSTFQMRTVVVTGKVTDENDNPLAGVNIRYVGQKAVVITDKDGKYSIELPDGDVELSFNYVGYKIYKVKPGALREINVKLELTTDKLETVVVTGLYSRPAENFSGSATKVSGEKLRSVNSMNVLEALKVFDPAVRMPDNIQLGSNPNALPRISLRGTNNFPVQQGNISIPSSGADFMSAYATNPSMPLFILDGFEVSLQKIYDLDINRVANITILKDAVGTSAYGSRASNGVIVIETLQPKAGKLQLSYNTTLQVTGPDLTSYKLLNAADKLELERLSGFYNAQRPDFQFYYDQLYSQRKADIERGVDTYWLSQPLQTGIGTKQSLFVEGGDEYIRYGASFGYTTNKGVMKGSSRDNYEGGVTLAYRKKNLMVRNQLNVVANRADNSPWGSFSDYSRLNQYWSPYDENGNIRKILEVTTREQGNFGRMYTNPMYNATLGTADYSKYFGITNNTFLEWRFNNGLKLTGKFGLTSQQDQSDIFLPADHTAFANITDFNSTDYFNRGRYTKNNGSFFSYDASLLADYNRSFGKHMVFGTFGLSAAEQNSRANGIVVTGFPNTRLDEVFLGNTYLRDSRPTGKNDISRRATMFTSLNYTYDRRYLADFSFNVDGSSQFGAKNRFAPFWAVGLGWNLHEEKFMSGLKGSIVNRLRLRAGLGTTGNQQFPPYMGISTYRYNTSQDYLGMLGATLIGYGNESLQWQQTLKRNVGADISLWNDRIALRLDAYLETTNDLLLDINTAPSLGVSSYKENIGKLQNKGIEGNLNAFILREEKTSTFWSVFVNAIHNRNKIQEISNSLKKMNQANDAIRNPDGTLSRLQTRPQLRFQEGQSVNAIWAVRSAGIDPSNGQELFIKKDGSLTYVWDPADKVIVGDALPKLSGNLGTNLSYKGIQLGLYFSYQLGGKRYNQTLVDRLENADIAYNVDERLLQGRWQKPGDITYFKGIVDITGRPITSLTNATSRFVQRDNFLELESLSLGYLIPDKATQKWGIRNTRLTFQVNNLFRTGTIRAERGLDYPFARNFTFNLSTSL